MCGVLLVGLTILKENNMEQYIKKSDLVAEIKELIRTNELYLSENNTDNIRFQKVGAYSVLNELLHFLDTLEVKEVDLEDEVDKDAYWNLFKDGTKLNIDSTTEINFDESTKFNLYDYIKMKEEEKTNSSKFYKRIFKNMPTVSMKIFSWWNRNKRKENKI